MIETITGNKILIKVCGMREAENIRKMEVLRIDWLGFIFAPQSPRYVEKCPGRLRKRAKRVGVFMDADTDEIIRRIREFRLDILQLHGSESPEYIARLREELSEAAEKAYRSSRISPFIQIMKAISIETEEDLATAELYAQNAETAPDYFLFDTKGKLAGGNGTQFDWSVLSHYHGSIPFLLSGGIGPEDAERVKVFYHPQCIGIDLNSRFEIAPALKDVALIRRFMGEIKT
ncbi:MAG: phosphoribosylanthranilate isomerase [Prevotella sp.]|nr:phosphoribosylanthranilate isomerase [Prevotella sp.]